MLGILQPCGECSLCLVVWPHNVQELYPWSSLGCCQVPSLPIQLPLFISCPWCNLLSFRLVYKGNLRFPRKNYFLLWMVESMNGERAKFHSTKHNEHHSSWHSSAGPSSSHHHRRNAVIRAESSSARDTNFIRNIFDTDNISASPKAHGVLHAADSQISTCDNLLADSPLCCPCKCCCSGAVCPCDVFVCAAIVFDPLLRLSQLGLAYQRDLCLISIAQFIIIAPWYMIYHTWYSMATCLLGHCIVSSDFVSFLF